MADVSAIQKMMADLAAEDDNLAEAMRQLGLQRARVQAARASLENLVSPPDEPVEFEGKLADACRAVLKKSKTPLSPLEVRDQLKLIGYDISKHNYIMASVHSVLKRLAESDAKNVKDSKGPSGTRYAWTGERHETKTTTASPMGAMGVSALSAFHDASAMNKLAEHYSSLIDPIMKNTLTDDLFKRLQEAGKVGDSVSAALKSLAGPMDYKNVSEILASMKPKI